MKNIVKTSISALILGSFLLGGLLQAAELEKLKGTFLVEQETFLLWYAKEKGWDKELGFDLELTVSPNSGSDILLSHLNDPDNWQVSAVGAVPAALYSENLKLDVIGIANDESVSTEILVRADSPILEESGWNQDYPRAKGSPETIRDKTYYIRKNTSSFFTFLCWLDLFGLNLHDVNFVDILPSEAVAELYENKGEGAVMWSPHSHDAARLGYEKAATAEDVGAYVPVILVADRAFAQNHQELIAKFLVMYLRAVEVQKKNLSDLVKPYQEFLRIYAGKNYSEEFCKRDLEEHPVYGLANQLAAFNTRGNRPSAILKLKRKLLNTFTVISLDLGEPKNYMSKAYDLNPTDVYLKLAKKLIETPK